MDFLSQSKTQSSLFMKSSQLTPKYLYRDEAKSQQDDLYNDSIPRFVFFAIDGKMIISKFDFFSIDHL